MSNDLPQPTPNDPIPDRDHALRYIGRKHVHDGVVNGSGFMRRPETSHSQEESASSINWMECFPFPVSNQVQEIKVRRRIKYEKRGILAKINIGQTKQYVATNATVAVTLAFLHDPLKATTDKPADPSHAGIHGIPIVNTPEAELLQDLLVHCIIEKFPVDPDR